VEEVRIDVEGHPNIRSTHKTTWQLTTENHLTPRGDCIIGINAPFGAGGLPKWLKNHIQSGGKLRIQIHCAGLNFEGTAEGHPDLELTDPVDMVFRRSEYTCARTVAIRSSFVARDLPMELVNALQQEAKMSIVIRPELE
jgi:hypothetical protein